MKKIKSFAVITFLTSLWLMSCEDVPEFEPDDTEPVVEAFLYAGQPVENIKISQVIPFGETNDSSELNGLNVDILWNGNTYPLLNDEAGNGRYYYPGDDLEIISGETYEITFPFDRATVSSSTTVPEPPSGLALSENSITVPQLIDIFDIREFAQSEDNNILVEWDNPDAEYYYLTIENLESNPEPIDLNDVLADFNFEFTSTPNQNDFFTMIPLAHYTQFGTHRIILYKVNPEYALLYETVNQDSRDLNEPFTNITNGVGIFSGFASDTVYLEINKQ